MVKKIFSSSFFTFFIVFIISTTLYLLTVSTRLTWANFGNDGGDFLAAILTKGIPHPTGYPTYTLLGVLFQFLPFGDSYFRAAMLSWLPAAVGAGFFALWVKTFLKENSKLVASIVAIFSGLIWGTLPFLWSQAIIIEVHGLQSLFLVLSIWWVWLIDQWGKYEIRKDWLFILSFLYGIALGNHITIIFVFPAILLALYFAYKRGFSSKHILAQILLMGCGGLIYLYLPIAASQFPPINWGNPQNWQGFFWVISGDPYQNLLLPTSITLIWTRISALAGLLLDQFGVFGVILAVIGVVNYPHKNKQFPYFLIYFFVIFSSFSIMYATDDSLNYLLMPFLVTTIWISLALKILFTISWKRIPVGILIIGAFFISFILKFPDTIQNIDPAGQYYPAEYAEYLLMQLPENAIVLTNSDPDSFPLWYYHFGLGWRSDVRIIVLPLTQFRWYQETLQHTYHDLQYPDLIQQISNNSQMWGESIPAYNRERPVCKNSIQRGNAPAIMTECSTGESLKFIIRND